MMWDKGDSIGVYLADSDTAVLKKKGKDVWFEGYDVGR